MKIDKKLKLTFEIETARGKCFVYADPIATDVFKTYFMTIAKAHHKLFSDGVQFALMSGHRIAAMTIEDVAKRDGEWEDEAGGKGRIGVENGLIREIIRLANIFVPTQSGWEMFSLDDAIKTGILTDEDADEVVNLLAFFTSASSMERRKAVEWIFGKLLSVLGGHLTSSSASEYMNSLPKLTATEASKAPAHKPLSVPS
jgi:hypothetical protein